jgi:hypothetical protein
MHTLFILRQCNCHPLLFSGFAVVANAGEPAPVENSLPPSILLSKPHNIGATLEMPEHLLIAPCALPTRMEGTLFARFKRAGVAFRDSVDNSVAKSNCTNWSI